MPADTPTPTTDLRPFSERVYERTLGSCHAVFLPTPVDDVVTWKGSFLTFPDFAAGEELVQELVMGLLDKGTRRRDRFAIARIVDDRGAQLRFYADGIRCGFYGRALREDVPELMAILAEQLREPLFDADEFEKARAHLIARVRRSMESTGSQASAALSRRLFPPEHPNHTPAPETQLERLATVTLDEVRAFHERHVGANALNLAVAGDVDLPAMEAVVRAHLADWPAVDVPARFGKDGADLPPGRTVVPMPDRDNVDVRMGHGLAVRRQDADYIPLYLATYILGGNFSARLMTTIRDEMGLTYGIHAGLVGISTLYHGYWQVGVTLSRENVERGIEATLDQVRRFTDEGVTADELEEKKTTITGSFEVGLATTNGLATALLKSLERGFGPGYLDRFPREVAAVDLDTVHAAMQRHLDPGRFHLALAGTLPEADAAS
ncbi:peptidase M16 [Rhodothermaceae bacterium RA]|nr:peptidase M16 [Rhodothermaceae bacterium RA]